MGVANHRSIGWSVATALHREGAELAFTYRRDRSKENLFKLLDRIGGASRFLTFPCDVSEDAQVEAAFTGLGAQWDRLDIVIHSIANAERSDLTGSFTGISRTGFGHALGTSAYSLISVTRRATPMLEAAGGGSIIAMTYDAVRKVVPGYNVMAVAKAALETEVRYLAAELGPLHIRVNAISAGPIRTRSSRAIRGISKLRSVAETVSPLRTNATQDDVSAAAVFLSSDLSRAVTGNIIFVDGGLHLVGTPVGPPSA